MVNFVVSLLFFTDVGKKKIYLFSTSMLWFFTAVCAGVRAGLGGNTEGA